MKCRCPYCDVWVIKKIKLTLSSTDCLIVFTHGVLLDKRRKICADRRSVVFTRVTQWRALAAFWLHGVPTGFMEVELVRREVDAVTWPDAADDRLRPVVERLDVTCQFRGTRLHWTHCQRVRWEDQHVELQPALYRTFNDIQNLLKRWSKRVVYSLPGSPPSCPI